MGGAASIAAGWWSGYEIVYEELAWFLLIITYVFMCTRVSYANRSETTKVRRVWNCLLVIVFCGITVYRILVQWGEGFTKFTTYFTGNPKHPYRQREITHPQAWLYKIMCGVAITLLVILALQAIRTLRGSKQPTTVQQGQNYS